MAIYPAIYQEVIAANVTFADLNQQLAQIQCPFLQPVQYFALANNAAHLVIPVGQQPIPIPGTLWVVENVGQPNVPNRIVPPPDGLVYSQVITRRLGIGPLNNISIMEMKCKMAGVGGSVRKIYFLAGFPDILIVHYNMNIVPSVPGPCVQARDRVTNAIQNLVEVEARLVGIIAGFDEVGNNPPLNPVPHWGATINNLEDIIVRIGERLDDLDELLV